MAMEKDIGRIKKNAFTDIVVRVDDFGGKIGLTIREFTSGDKYTGFTKAGTRIPAESFAEFKKMINSIDEKELAEMKPESQPIAKGSYPSKGGFGGKPATKSAVEDVPEEDLM